MLASTCFAELNAPKTCDVGELVRIEAPADINLKWVILPETPNFEVVNNRAFLSAQATDTEFLIIVSGARADEPFLWTAKIVVTGEATPLTLDVKVSRWLDLVESEHKLEEAKRLASVFRTLSTTEIEATKILAATAVANRQALGESLEAWMPFLDALGSELDAFVENKQLETREDYREIWSLIAQGIEKGIE